MREGPIRGREVVLEPLLGTAYVILLTAVLIGIGYLIAVVAAWLG